MERPIFFLLLLLFKAREVAVWQRAELPPVRSVGSRARHFLFGSAEVFVAALHPLPGLRILLLSKFLS